MHAYLKLYSTHSPGYEFGQKIVPWVLSLQGRTENGIS
jgi:hypothetical protein